MTTTEPPFLYEDDLFELGYKCFTVKDVANYAGKLVCTTTTTTSTTTTTTTSLDVEDLNNRGYKFDVEDLMARGYKCFLIKDVPEYVLADDVEVVCDEGKCFGCVLRSERQEERKSKTVDEMKALSL